MAGGERQPAEDLHADNKEQQQAEQDCREKRKAAKRQRKAAEQHASPRHQAQGRLPGA